MPGGYGTDDPGSSNIDVAAGYGVKGPEIEAALPPKYGVRVTWNGLQPSKAARHQ
jgi:hypothetical protein